MISTLVETRSPSWVNCHCPGILNNFSKVLDSGRWRFSPSWGHETNPTGSRLNTHTLLVGRGILNPDSIKIAHKIARGWEGTQLRCGSSILKVATIQTEWRHQHLEAVEPGLLELSKAGGNRLFGRFRCSDVRWESWINSFEKVWCFRNRNFTGTLDTKILFIQFSFDQRTLQNTFLNFYNDAGRGCDWWDKRTPSSHA